LCKKQNDFLEEAQMKLKESNVFFTAGLAILLFMALAVMTGRAGNLEPNAPPEPTMVTLGQISAQIEALSSPVKKVVRGVITFPYDANDVAIESTQDLSSAVDPNHSVVLLSDAIASECSTPGDEWTARNAACVVSLTETQIRLRVEGLRSEQQVSYQIIEYK
jgi:hypothetical protein